MNELVQNQIPQGLHLRYSRALENSGKEYQVYRDQIEVEDSWVRIYTIKSDESNADTLSIGLNLPSSGDILSFEGSKATGLKKINTQIVEYKRVDTNGSHQILFPSGAKLPNRMQFDIQAELDTDGSTSSISIKKGSFPDQIVIDTDGAIWFTQPSNNLLTSYDPKTKEWQHIIVGNSPDGLFIDSNGLLWFGEYTDKHLGVYNPTTKDYKRYKMPYADSSPAIPYEDHKGNIWVSDHQSNKVSVLDIETKEWDYFEPPSENAWIVQLLQPDNGNPDIYATHCYSNSIGHIDYESRTFREIPLGVSGRPAFFCCCRRIPIYKSLVNRLIYDPRYRD